MDFEEKINGLTNDELFDLFKNNLSLSQIIKKLGFNDRISLYHQILKIKAADLNFDLRNYDPQFRYEINPRRCLECNTPIPYKQYKKFCNSSCSISYSNKHRILNKDHKNSISKSLKQFYIINPKDKHLYNCVICGKELKNKNKYHMCKSCFSKNMPDEARKIRSKIGKESAAIQAESRRSKNEKLFCEMCESFFQTVKHNEPIFNGWDADVIIEDIKVAVLWNGVWHYKKITESHSVEQVQNRDNIKLKEIESAGYKPYIIKDMGKYNPDFVKEEFDKFIQNCLKT